MFEISKMSKWYDITANTFTHVSYTYFGTKKTSHARLLVRMSYKINVLVYTGPTHAMNACITSFRYTA